MNGRYKVLLLGSGGREHSIAWKLNQSPDLEKLFCIPGNPGISELAECHQISLQNHSEITQFISKNEIQLVICGPEAPLADGLMNHLSESLGNTCILIGPKLSGARLESSKNFSKEFMFRHNIPTAAYKTFRKEQLSEAKEFILSMKTPIVLKADGLAAGKGVLICQSHNEAIEEIELMLDGKFGEASEQVVIEEFLSGIEFSSFILTDGKYYVELPDAKDYKRIGEKDTGLNTGGMGSISPVHFIDNILREKIRNRIINPTIEGLQKENIPYQGFIFFGLINVNGDPFVIEYNCRLGDPETESIMLRIKSDLLQAFIACGSGTLNDYSMSTHDHYAATVFLVSGGYPDNFEKGKEIFNYKDCPEDSYIFHAGTQIKDGKLVTSGGRVIALSSISKTKDQAIQKSLYMAKQIQYDGKYYRKDIGFDLE
ncbi:MAG: phosphoribosylamine--glycine ligase [Saprospiraceae bacterium]|nr:phosphoribosylamine--glycine ligase [Saprospiraceae bacterium]